MSLSCGCDADGNYKFYTSSLRRARKEHQCRECDRIIRRGELYEHASFRHGDYIGSRNTCEKCSDLAASLAEMGFCWYEGELDNAYQEYLKELP